MANHMREIAKMLGMELGEVFQVDAPSLNDYVFRFSDDDLQVSAVNGGNYTWGIINNKTKTLLGLLYGNLSIRKLPWKPQKGDSYYIPYITPDEKEMYDSYTWLGNSNNTEYCRMGLVCKTKEEAIALTKKMLAVAKEVRNNG